MTDEENRPWLPAAVISAVFAVLVVPLIFLQRGGTAGAYDQETYHLPTIARFARELPWVELDAVRTATGPGYHYVMALLYRVTGDQHVVLQLASALFSLAFVLVVLHVLSRLVDRWVAVTLLLPLVLSPYVLQSAVWMNTDNAAAIFVVLALAAAVDVAGGAPRQHRAGIAAALAVVVRQIHLWVVGPLVLAGALASGRTRRSPLIRALAWSVLPAAVVVALVLAWGGLTPPAFADINASRFSPSVLPFTLALGGMAGVFYLVAARGWPVRLATPWRVVALVGAAGGLSALLVPTDADISQGRGGGGLWKVVDRLPVVADRSMLLIVLAAFGAVVLFELARAAAERAPRSTAVLVAALASFVAAQSATNYVYQRYVEPIVLIVVALLAAVAIGRGAQVPSRRGVALAVGGLIAIQALAAIVVVHRPVLDGGQSLPYPPEALAGDQAAVSVGVGRPASCVASAAYANTCAIPKQFQGSTSRASSPAS